MPSVTGKARKKDGAKAKTGAVAPVADHREDAAMVVDLAPGVVSEPKVCAGDPILAGTRTPVHDVVAYAKRYGWDLARVRTIDLPHLSMDQVEAAAAYYRAHEAEIEELLRKRREDYQRLLEDSQASR